jgi:pyruvate kinase
MDLGVIVTIPPYATFLEEVAKHPLVRGFRLNTVMPLHEPPAKTLQRLSSFGQPLWVDLKGRQLRVVGAAIPPYTELRISHPIRVSTPVDAFFSDGQECTRVLSVEEDRLILEDGPRRLVGPGESVNIAHPTLEILGTLTETDKTYLAAMHELGLKKVMLSYTELPQDAAEVLNLLPGAEIVQKIESQKGLKYARQDGAQNGRLMAARGDLYVEVLQPHRIISALRDIIQADPQAIAASRIFDSLVNHPVPSCADISDLGFLISLGYRTFMLGDVQCLHRETVLEALNLVKAVAGQF